jgi:hypothetical protein
MKKCAYLIGLFLIIAALTFLFVTIVMSSAQGEEEELYSCWVLCQPNDYINARQKPTKKSMIAGRYEARDELITDGVIRNNYVHIVNTSLECGDAWIYAGYISYEEPEALGACPAVVTSRARLAARKHIGGKVRKWLNNGDKVKVYYMTEEWCVTNRGFVKTQYIELEGY